MTVFIHPLRSYSNTIGFQSSVFFGEKKTRETISMVQKNTRKKYLENINTQIWPCIPNINNPKSIQTVGCWWSSSHHRISGETDISLKITIMVFSFYPSQKTSTTWKIKTKKSLNKASFLFFYSVKSISRKNFI